MLTCQDMDTELLTYNNRLWIRAFAEMTNKVTGQYRVG